MNVEYIFYHIYTPEGKCNYTIVTRICKAIRKINGISMITEKSKIPIIIASKRIF